MKQVLILSSAVLIMLFQISCGEHCSGSNCEEHPDSDINIDDTVDPDASDTEIADTDENAAVTDDDGCPGAALDTVWMTPEDSWKSWSYLKMMGEVYELGGDAVDAVFTEGKAKLSDVSVSFEKGSYAKSFETVVAMTSSYKMLNYDEVARTATVDFWEMEYMFPGGLINAMKESGMYENGSGAYVTVTNTLFDIEFNETGAVIAQFLRKKCYSAISRTEEVEIDGEIYDVPIGGIAGCFENNVDASAGEELKMMFKNELADDKETVEAYYNTNPDGTLMDPDDENYTPQCQCYKKDGETKVDCDKMDEEPDDDTVSDEDSVII